MTFDSREKSQHSGQPVDCYRFVCGGDSWLYTSADQVITLPVGVFVPETIHHSEMAFSDEDIAQSIEVTVPRTNPVGALIAGPPPPDPILLQAWQAHRGEESAAVAWFSGTVDRGRREGSEVKLACGTTMSKLNRGFPVLTIQVQCNHAVYGPGCNLDPAPYVEDATVTSVDGVTVVSNDFTSFLRTLKGGLIAKDGEKRSIVDHPDQGDTIILLSPLPGLQSLDQVQVYWGCAHTESACRVFNNLPNHCGWARIPSRDPFNGGVI